MGLSRKTILLISLISLLGWMLFILALGTPLKLNFDEFHYIPAAKQFLVLGKNQNWEHPPLAKMIIAIGVAVFGDDPIGWRIMSTLAGAVTLAGMGALGALWFTTLSTTAWIMLVTLFNQLLYVQSRIAMLDTFMFAAMIWSIVFFYSSGNANHSEKKHTFYLYVSGALLGLAIAFKWFAVVLILPYAVMYLQHRKSLVKGIIGLGIIPASTYLATFLPLLLLKQEQYRIWDIFKLQQLIYEGQRRVVSPHPYTSEWWSWPFPIRPIWYAFDKEGAQGEFVRGVFLIGNPLVMWAGFISVMICLWDSLHIKHSTARWIVALYALFWLAWAVIPRKIHFYYYYYPAGMMLSFALAYGFLKYKLNRARWIYLGAVIFIFTFFYPVLSGIPIPTESFRQWMWLSTWI